MTKIVSILSLALVAAPSLAHAESWALLGLRDVDGPSIGAELDEVRALLEAGLPDGVRLLSPEEFSAELGLPEGAAPDPEEALAEAELLFFQLEYDAARERLEEAILAVGRGQVDATPELGRSLRLLLAHIHLQEPGGRERAVEALRHLACLSTLPDSVRRTVGGEVASLWDEVRAACSARAEGWLVVDCTGCHGGEVWLEGVPAGTTQQSIGLAPGTYQMVLRGLAGSEGRRSFPRKVVIAPGGEARVLVDLAAEAAWMDDGGPSLRDEGELSFRRASYLAAMSGVDRLLVWRFGASAVEVREVESTGVRATWTREPPQDDRGEALEQLVDSILGRSATPVAEPVFVPAPPELFVTKEDAPGWRPVAKWSTLGATVVMAGVAGWLMADAASASGELERLQSRTESYVSVQEARRAVELSEIIESRRDWSAVFWTGAAVGAVGTILLFLDPGAE